MTKTTSHPRWLIRLDRLLDRVSAVISGVCTVLLVLLLLTMLLATTLQVVARYIFPTVVGGPTEIARMAMVATVFIGLPVLARHSEHIALDLLQEKVRSARLREGVLRAALCAELIFLVILSVFSYELVEQLSGSPQQLPALQIRLFWTRLPVPIGASLGAFVTAAVLVRRLLVTGSTVYGRPTRRLADSENMAGRGPASAEGTIR